MSNGVTGQHPYVKCDLSLRKPTFLFFEGITLELCTRIARKAPKGLFLPTCAL